MSEGANASPSDDTPDFTADPIERIKSVLSYPPVYLQLVNSLIPGALTHPVIRKSIVEMYDWLEHASEPEIRAKGPLLWEHYDRVLQEAFKRLRPRISWKVIAHDYWRLCKVKAFSFATGLSYGWVAERFDCSALTTLRDLPGHARVGIGHHAGGFAVEEAFLLRDAFYLLVRAKQVLERLVSLAEKAKSLPNPDVAMGQGNMLKQKACTESRLAVFSFYAFVECFVNSVGEDFIAKNPSTPPNQQEILRGYKKRRYLSTEKKIEKIAEIIRDDGTRPLILTDPKQMREPFTSFVEEVKGVRDAAAHYAKGKAAIFLSPEQWVPLAEDACRTCMDVAKEFWQACYPGRSMPDYLQQLDVDRHIDIAEKRVAGETDERWFDVGASESGGVSGTD